MITDQNLRVTEAGGQTVTVNAPSTNSIDLGVERDIALGAKISAHWIVDQDVTAAGAATVTIQIICATDAALTAGIGVLGQTPAMGKAILTVGRPPVVLEINPDIADSRNLFERYLGVQWVIGAPPLLTGKFTVDFVMDYGDGQRFYASGFTLP
jgi:hypothetical protein